MRCLVIYMVSIGLFMQSSGIIKAYTNQHLRFNGHYRKEGEQQAFHIPAYIPSQVVNKV